MKTIRLVDSGAYKAKDVLRQVLGLPGAGGINVEQMRQRVNLLNALEGAEDMLTLEDAPFEMLKNTIETFPFGAAHPDLLAVLEAAMTPVAPAA